MSDSIDDVGPAFPTKGSREEIPGMSLRDYFAAAAITGVMNDLQVTQDEYQNEDVAKACYEIANAMIAERGKK